MRYFVSALFLLLCITVNGQEYFRSLEEHSVPFASYGFELTSNFEEVLDQVAEPANLRIDQSIKLPLPDGKEVDLTVRYAPIMAPALAERYPVIKSYKIEGDNITGRIGMTYKGFHGMLFTPKGTVYIDNHPSVEGSYYSYYRQDYMEHHKGIKTHRCYTDADPVDVSMTQNSNPIPSAERSGDKLRTYRLALACTGEYGQYHGGTVSGALSAMVISMNRVNGVYERDFSITMELIGNTDDLIYLNAFSDPYTNNNGGQMLGQNQSTINSVIGSVNYDIGHVFSTGGGGIASLGSVCSAQSKARGVTGSNAPTGDPFDIDYVAHEMGHQFGANHTQNNNCNRTSSSAYEPGSASTIMGYAGICSPNIQNNSDDYFHAHSYDQVISFAHNGSGNSCASISNTGNSAPQVSVPDGGFYIPIETPFRLDGSATDANGDDMTYCWEQMDLGPSGHPNTPSGNAPIFRSWDPSDVSYRVCPKMLNIIIGTTVIGETYPTYDRDLTFRLTARDENSAGGGVGFEEIEFEVSEDAGPFVVTSPAQGEEVESVNGYEITWDVAGTDQSPVNCQIVTIDLCKFDQANQVLNVIETLAEDTPNDGAETVSISQTNLGGGYYIRVKAADNIFFNLNGGAFKIVEPAVLEDADITLSLLPDYVNGLMALNWNDDFSSETNWYVEKSIGTNASFTVIDTLVANSVSYLDYNVLMYGEEYYYRVFAENAVSTSDYSNEVVYQGLGLSNDPEVKTLVYPNPASGLVTISHSQQIDRITMYSVAGAKIQEWHPNSSNAELNLERHASGIYLLQIQTENGDDLKRLELK